jgi:hypothetical protein
MNTCSAYGNTGDVKDNTCSVFPSNTSDRSDQYRCSVMNPNQGSTDQCSAFSGAPNDKKGSKETHCSINPWPTFNKPLKQNRFCSVVNAPDFSGTCSAMADSPSIKCSVFGDQSTDDFCSVKMGEDAACTTFGNTMAQCSVIPSANPPKETFRGKCSVQGGKEYRDSDVRECRGKSN